MASDAARNRQLLESLAGVGKVTDFAYPYGQISIRAKRELGRSYRTLRSVYAGLNGPRSDLHMLRANPLYSHSLDLNAVRLLAEHASRLGAWLIFYTHSVTEAPDAHSCTARDLEKVIEICKHAGLCFRSVKSVSSELVGA